MDRLKCNFSTYYAGATAASTFQYGQIKIYDNVWATIYGTKSTFQYGQIKIP